MWLARAASERPRRAGSHAPDAATTHAPTTAATKPAPVTAKRTSERPAPGEKGRSSRLVRMRHARLPTVSPVRASRTHRNTTHSSAARAARRVPPARNPTALATTATATTSIVKAATCRPTEAGVPATVAPRGRDAALVTAVVPGAAPVESAAAASARAAGGRTEGIWRALVDAPHHRHAAAPACSGSPQFQQWLPSAGDSTALIRTPSHA